MHVFVVFFSIQVLRFYIIAGLPEVSVPSMMHLTGTGYTITITCSVKNTYPEVSNVYWQRYLHGSTTMIHSNSIGIKGVTVENPSLIIPYAMESMTGEYICFAENSVGTGSSLPAKLTGLKTNKFVVFFKKMQKYRRNITILLHTLLSCIWQNFKELLVLNALHVSNLFGLLKFV